MATLALNVEILGEFKKLTNATVGAQSSLQSLQSKAAAVGTNIARIAGAIGLSLGFRAIVDGAKDSIAAASDLEQQFGALDSIFKGNAAEMKLFSKEMNKIGLSSADAARQSAYLGAMLKGSGLSIDDTSEKTKDLVELAGDLAATFGGPTSEAVSAIASLMRGERDPIERYGVSLKQVDINAQMLTDAKNGLVFASEKEAAMNATLTLLYAKTVDAQGQAAREADTYAAKLAELQARMKDASVELGNSLLPMLQKLADFFIDSIPDIQHFFSLLNESLDDPQVKGSVSRMDQSLQRLGASIGALFGSTQEDEAKGFVNFWTILSSLVTQVADKVNMIVAAMAALTGNTKPIEQLIQPFVQGGLGMLGYEFLPSLPNNSGRSNQPRSSGNAFQPGPQTVNINVNSTNATPTQIVDKIKEYQRQTGIRVFQ
jgi:hypothetical protein